MDRVSVPPFSRAEVSVGQRETLIVVRLRPGTGSDEPTVGIKTTLQRRHLVGYPSIAIVAGAFQIEMCFSINLREEAGNDREKAPTRSVRNRSVYSRTASLVGCVL